MRSTALLVALLSFLTRPVAAEHVERLEWLAGADKDEAYLSYAVPDSDNADLRIVCDVKSGQTTIYPSLLVREEMDGLRLPLRLASPGGELHLTALAVWQEAYERIDLEARVTPGSLAQLLDKPGELAMESGGNRITVPLDETTRKALATFLAACPGKG